jgi:hypothetical protein
MGTPAYERQLYRMLKEVEASKRAVARTRGEIFNWDHPDQSFDDFMKNMEQELRGGGGGGTTGAPTGGQRDQGGQGGRIRYDREGNPIE